jgi:hypothetical protein
MIEPVYIAVSNNVHHQSIMMMSIASVVGLQISSSNVNHDPNFLRKLEEYINKVKAEAAYFFEADGNRVASFIVDIQSADQIPVIAEPLFSGMDAHVELHPV